MEQVAPDDPTTKSQALVFDEKLLEQTSSPASRPASHGGRAAR